MHDSITFSQNTSAQIASFRNMRRIATAALLLVTLIFTLCRLIPSSSPWVGYVRAFCEAAMVGALADWFAVTALFRRPLGLPIPHTAIIPENKDRIGRSLGYFIQSSFLSDEVLSSKLGRTDVVSIGAHWLKQANNAQWVSKKFVSVLPELIRTLDDEDVHRFLHESLHQLVSSLQLAPIFGHFLEVLSSKGKHQALLEELIRVGNLALTRHESFLRETLREEMPWYVPGFVHDKVYQSVLTSIRKRLAQIAANPNDRARAHFSEYLARLIHELKTSPEFEKIGEDFKKWLFASPASSYVEQLWMDLKQLTLQDADAEHSFIKTTMKNGLQVLANNIYNDALVRNKLNIVLRSNLTRLIRAYRHTVVDFISGIVSTWDTDTLIGKLELEVGRDLQYIRLNGTLVGGLVGLFIYIVAG